MKSVDDICFVVQARLNSERLPNKMLKDFCGTSLIEVCVDKVLQSSVIPKENFYLAVYEQELADLGESKGVNVFRRSKKSVTEEGMTLQKLYEWHDQLDYKYYVMVNACNPLLTIETIDKFIQAYLNSPNNGLFGVIEKRTYYWDKHGAMMNDWPAGKLLDTKLVDPVYEAAHCLYAGVMDEIKDGIHMGTYAKKDDPELYVIEEEVEAFDIDWPWQFDIAEILYKLKK